MTPSVLNNNVTSTNIYDVQPDRTGILFVFERIFTSIAVCVILWGFAQCWRRVRLNQRDALDDSSEPRILRKFQYAFQLGRYGSDRSELCALLPK